jgi:hypothetical protein
VATKVVKTIKLSEIGLIPGQTYILHVEEDGDTMTFKQEVPDERDITAYCKVVLKSRALGNGVYMMVKHKDDNVALVDALGSSKMHVYTGYRVERTPGAHYSFRVYKLS